MRPRRCRRGKAGQPLSHYGDQRSFNEAPALPPGKGLLGRPPPRPSSCGFNEAPALPPGKGQHEAGHASLGLQASMRPRRCRRGKVGLGIFHPDAAKRASMRPRRCRRGKARASAPAAWSAPGFNEAPALPPGKGVRIGQRQDGGLPASMRPRRCRRGKVRKLQHGRATALQASMRPRL